MLTLLRHGRTAANAAGLLQGRMDTSLDEVGLAQAHAAAAALGPVDLMICSPLRRAQQTAAVFDVPVTIDERWIELDYGSYDGRQIGEVPAEFWDKWRTDVNYVPDGGESLADLGRRVRGALDELLEAMVERHVVVVSHVSPIKAALAWALGSSDEIAWRCHLRVASVTRIELTKRGPLLHAFNDVSHLRGDHD